MTPVNVASNWIAGRALEAAAGAISNMLQNNAMIKPLRVMELTPCNGHPLGATQPLSHRVA
jgi:hypothetical protein